MLRRIGRVCRRRPYVLNAPHKPERLASPLLRLKILTDASDAHTTDANRSMYEQRPTEWPTAATHTTVCGRFPRRAEVVAIASARLPPGQPRP